MTKSSTLYGTSSPLDAITARRMYAGCVICDVWLCLSFDYFVVLYRYDIDREWILSRGGSEERISKQCWSGISQKLMPHRAANSIMNRFRSLKKTGRRVLEVDKPAKSRSRGNAANAAQNGKTAQKGAKPKDSKTSRVGAPLSSLTASRCMTMCFTYCALPCLCAFFCVVLFFILAHCVLYVLRTLIEFHSADKQVSGRVRKRRLGKSTSGML